MLVFIFIMITIINVKEWKEETKSGFLEALTGLHCFGNINIQCSCTTEPRWPTTPEFPEQAWTHPQVHAHKFTQMRVRSAELFLELAVNHSAAACLYKRLDTHSSPLRLNCKDWTSLLFLSACQTYNTSIKGEKDSSFTSSLLAVPQDYKWIIPTSYF